MPEQPLPTDMASWMREMERRLAALERAPRLAATAMNDDEGNERIVFGDLGDGSYGIRVKDAAGRIVFEVEETGLSRPVMNLPVQRTSSSTWNTTSSGTFTPLWSMIFTQLTANAIQVRANTNTPVGTTAEYRLYWDGTATGSGVHTIVGDGTDDMLTWSWAPATLADYIGFFGATSFSIQARVTSGAGPAAVYHPELAFVAPADDISATSDGL